MLTRMNNYIFICTLLIMCIGCDNPFIQIDDVDYGHENGEQLYECEDCVLELSIPNSNIDSDGYYHVDFLQGNSWTYSMVEADIGVDYQFVEWDSDTEYCIEWNYTTECTDLINGQSYSGEDGISNTILGFTEEYIGSVITIYASYYDNYQKYYLDSMKVVIDE